MQRRNGIAIVRGTHRPSNWRRPPSEYEGIRAPIKISEAGEIVEGVASDHLLWVLREDKRIQHQEARNARLRKKTEEKIKRRARERRYRERKARESKAFAS